jgi:PIN domain nuclease of toxin-antitoxin system
VSETREIAAGPQIALWITTGTLPAEARRLIDEADAVFVSAISPWEISIKASHGRIKVEPMDLLRGFQEANLLELPVKWEHAVIARGLVLRDHRDPFDRMLVAQAIAEPLRLVTADKALAAYSDLVTVI